MENPSAGWKFDNSYTRLPDMFFIRQNPVPVKTAKLAVFNSALAKSLGLNGEALSGQSGAEVFAGNVIPPGAEPIAQAYAGHQFGYLNMLGDGRAVLLGEQITPAGERIDIQLKGSGQTPFSRSGDGRAALGPMLREYIISEAMHALGIPTTRSLAVVTTGEEVYRDSALPGAVLTRTAKSHIRVGTFVYAAKVEGGGEPAVRALADYAIQRHYPQLASEPNKYFSFLRAVMDRQASLVAKWMNIGFIHGVMNTDNVAISGETIDYGPCAFMDTYSPTTVFSSIDRNGRYAYGNQPKIAAWNLARFAETLLPLLEPNLEDANVKAQKAVEEFQDRYQFHALAGMRAKLGLATEEESDLTLISGLFRCMEAEKADYTNTFRALSQENLPEQAVFRSEAFRRWHAEWEARLSRQDDSRDEVSARMRANNPAIVPRNHRVEEALAAASEKRDFSVMERLLGALKDPYTDSSAHNGYSDPATAGNENYQTFCGT